MAVKVTCHSCQKTYKVGPSGMGQQFNCSKCGAGVEVPPLEGADPTQAEDLVEAADEAAIEGDYQLAVRLIQDAIILDPEHFDLYRIRARIYGEWGRYEPSQAIDEYEAGRRYALLGEYRLATKRFRKAARLDEGFTWPRNDAAWIYATCPDESIRDANKALKYATEACTHSKFICGSHLGTLAAALARHGLLDEAVGIGERALGFAKPEQERHLRHQLSLYAHGLPYVEVEAQRAVDPSDMCSKEPPGIENFPMARGDFEETWNRFTEIARAVAECVRKALDSLHNRVSAR